MAQTLGSLPIDAKVKYGRFRNTPMKWLVKGINHPGFPSGAVTLVTERIIKLMAHDAKEAANSDSNRKNNGNNRYIYSNLRQWLNSEAGPGQWYSSAHSADAPPSAANVYASGGVAYNPYDTIAGFISEFSAVEKAALLSTTLTVGKASVDGGGTETCVDKMFLLSTAEVGLTGDFTEGQKLAGFNDNASRVAIPSAPCVDESNYQNNSFNVNSGWYWWLRSPYASNSCSVWSVDTDGSLGLSDAYNGGRGARPACNLSSSILVSDNVDNEGYYTVIFNELPLTPPVINIPATVYGTLTADISWGASSDPDGFIAGYALERRYDNGAWAVIYNGANLNFGDLVSTDYESIQYRVRAVDNKGDYSPYVTSAIRFINHNPPPAVSLGDGDLGVFSDTSPQIVFTISDTDSPVVNINVKLDGAEIIQQAGILDGDNTVTIPPGDWVKILNGHHILIIEIVDVHSNKITRTLTFQKSVGEVKFAFQTPLAADDKPNVIVASVVGAMPAGSELLVEACNNGFDDEPEWEDITVPVVQRAKYFFQNQTKTADDWGVNIRVTLRRGTATQPVFITSVGGNFA